MCRQRFGNLSNASPCLTVSFCLWHPFLWNWLNSWLICSFALPFTSAARTRCASPPPPTPPLLSSAWPIFSFRSPNSQWGTRVHLRLCQQVFWYEKLSHLQLWKVTDRELCWLFFGSVSAVMWCNVGIIQEQIAFAKQVNLKVRPSNYTVYIPTHELCDCRGCKNWTQAELNEECSGARTYGGRSSSRVGAAGPLHQKEKSWGSSVIWSGSVLDASCWGKVSHFYI